MHLQIRVNLYSLYVGNASEKLKVLLSVTKQPAMRYEQTISTWLGKLDDRLNDIDTLALSRYYHSHHMECLANYLDGAAGSSEWQFLNV